MGVIRNTFPDNQLQTVTTFQMWSATVMASSCPAVHFANKKFNDFQKIAANLGDTVSFNDFINASINKGTIEPRQQELYQPKIELKIDQQASLTINTAIEEDYFNLEAGDVNWIDAVSKAGVKRLGLEIEDFLSYQFTKCHRFYGDWDEQGVVNPINSTKILSEIGSSFKEYGTLADKITAVLPEHMYNDIIDGSADKYNTVQNNELANYNWYKRSYNGVEWTSTESSIHFHEAGTAGQAQYELTVVSTNDPTGKNVTQITCSNSSLGKDANAIKAGDSIVFKDTSLRAMTFYENKPMFVNKVTNTAKYDSGSNANTVVITFDVPFRWDLSAKGKAVVLNKPIVAGMKLKVTPNHRVGYICYNDCLYLAQPPVLKDTAPFPMSAYSDDETGLGFTYYKAFDPLKLTTLRNCPVIYGAVLNTTGAEKIILPV